MERIDAVVFDMDGLMFDTERLWLDAAIKTNEVYGYDVPPSLIIECMGLRKDKIDIKLKECMGEEFDPIKYRELNKIFMKKDVDENGLKIKKGLIELLEFLKSKNIKMAVASSSSNEKIDQRFSEAGLSKEYFDYIIGGDKVTEPKPNPQIYLNACDVLGVEPKYAIALEDSELGLMSAYNAGMKAVWIPDLKKPSDEVLKLIYKKFDSLAEVISLFE